MAFFPSFIHKIGELPLICYVDVSVASLAPYPLNEGLMREAIDEQWGFPFATGLLTCPFPEDTNFLLGFLWADGEDLMADFWIQRQLYTYGRSAPLTDIVVFRCQSQVHDTGMASGNTRIVSGLEELHRRQLDCSLRDYLYGRRPVLPPALAIPWPT